MSVYPFDCRVYGIPVNDDDQDWDWDNTEGKFGGFVWARKMKSQCIIYLAI